MDRTQLVTAALATGRIEVDFETGKIYSRQIRGHEGKRIELQGTDLNGYTTHNISFQGTKMPIRAHQIIWFAAHGAVPSGLMLDHINRENKDNRLSNLRLATPKQNAANRPTQLGQANKNAKLLDADKLLIAALYRDSDATMQEIAELFGVSDSTISNVVNAGLVRVSTRAKQLKAYGNSIVPQVALEIFKAIQHVENTPSL